MRWAAQRGDIWTENYRLIYTESDNGQQGVGFMLDKKMGQLMDIYLQVSTRQ